MIGQRLVSLLVGRREMSCSSADYEREEMLAGAISGRASSVVRRNVGILSTFDSGNKKGKADGRICHQMGK